MIFLNYKTTSGSFSYSVSGRYLCSYSNEYFFASASFSKSIIE